MAGIFWISFNDGVPVSDQIHVHEEAQRIAGFLDSPFDTGYFSYYQRNRGVTLLAALAFKIFGNHLYSFQIFNLAALLITYCSICKASELIYKNPLITSITAFLLMLFYPLFIYTSYLYGTLLSAGFASLGLYAATALCVKRKNEIWPFDDFCISIWNPYASIGCYQSCCIGYISFYPLQK